MTDCEKCGFDGMPQSHPANVGPEKYVTVQAEVWPETYTGMVDGSGEVVEDDGRYGVRIDIDQSAYATENHFKDREKYEAMPHVEIEDIPGEDVVILWWGRETATVTGWSCPDCGYAWHEVIGELPDNYPGL